MRYVSLLPEVAGELQRYPIVISDERIFPPQKGGTWQPTQVGRKFRGFAVTSQDLELPFRDLRHTFASWYMMNGHDLYELAKFLDHSNMKMTERYAKLAMKHIAKTGHTAREVWKLMEP